MTKDEIQKVEAFSNMEAVVIGGDLSKLTPEQRVQYYQKVCQSVGINPLTRPFNYITLNNKLTLYATKDATDQLRSLHNVSIDDIDITEDDKSITVKVKGHDDTNRSDVEIGVVSKGDMQGNLANVRMKAVTKAKRRLTLSLCGLGWLDETEIETIKDARPVVVTETGDISISDENINQETGEVVTPQELIDPMGDWAVKYAAQSWNIDTSDAAKAIAAKKLGKKFDKAEFISIVNNAPKEA
jgi:hypothetical protein